MTPATMLFFDGIKQSIGEWALDYGITPAVIIARLERGLSIEQAITVPMVTAPAQKLTGKHLDRYIKSLPKRRRPKRRQPRTRPNKPRAPSANTPRYIFDGKTLTLTEWARRIGVSKHTLYHRFKKGWPLDRALTEPATMGRRRSQATDNEATNA